MDFVVSALDYLLGIPIFGWGTQVGFIYKGLLLLVALLLFTAYILLADRKIWARNWFSELNGSGWPSTALSARKIAQSSFASPGGNTARSASCTRPSVLT